MHQSVEPSAQQDVCAVQQGVNRRCAVLCCAVQGVNRRRRVSTAAVQQGVNRSRMFVLCSMASLASLRRSLIILRRVASSLASASLAIPVVSSSSVASSCPITLNCIQMEAKAMESRKIAYKWRPKLWNHVKLDTNGGQSYGIP